MLAAAEEAVKRQPGPEYRDLTDRPFVTLDPESSVDLDQAFSIELAGDDIILHYAIADVGLFVRPGDPLDREAFERAVTVYLPDRKRPSTRRSCRRGRAASCPVSSAPR